MNIHGMLEEDSNRDGERIMNSLDWNKPTPWTLGIACKGHRSNGAEQRHPDT